MADAQSYRRQPVDSYPQAVSRWSELSIACGYPVDNFFYFHCVETPKPAAMKPKPTTMFQLPKASMGSRVSVT